MGSLKWYEISETTELVTPSLIVYPNRIKENIRRMIKIAGFPERLRPHIKTYKMAEVIQLQMQAGINKFKSATIPETELLAKCQAEDVLLAMQPVGPNIQRYINLIQLFPKTRFSTIVDNLNSIHNLASVAKQLNIQLELFLDINNGMNRTGIVPGSKAIYLYKEIDANPYLIIRGLHIYDGHIHESNLEKRKLICNQHFLPVQEMINNLNDEGMNVETIIAGGTPTFPIHAQTKGIQLSPGTPLLWDAGYANNYQDLNFLPAAVLATRVISNPISGVSCFDLGHKSVAPEMPMPRIKFLGNQLFKQIGHSEEHLVVEYKEINPPEIGDLHYTLPIHICPTVSKYDEVLVVENHKVIASWKIAARDH